MTYYTSYYSEQICQTCGKTFKGQPDKIRSLAKIHARLVHNSNQAEINSPPIRAAASRRNINNIRSIAESINMH